MPKVVAKDVRVRDLPPELTAGLDAAPGDVVCIRVDAEWREEPAKLSALSTEASAEAKRRGLIGGRPAELLNGR